MAVIFEMNQNGPNFSCEPTFEQHRQLITDLTWSGGSAPRLTSAAIPPDPDPYVPGQPSLPLSGETKIFKFLERDLCHDHLNRLYPLFWLVATQRSDHISALHEQIVRGREIIITEDPGLHLLWYHNRVFIKPLPPCLTSHAFWKEFLCHESSTELRKAALGYMRSYFHLIKCQSDVNVAKEKKLINIGEDLDDMNLLRFLDSFESVSDTDVTPRYRYGELGLSQINLYIKFYERRLYYRKMGSEFLVTSAFIFVSISTTLSAMQVVLAAQPPNGNQTHRWQTFTSVSQWSAIIVLLFSAACALFPAFVVCVVLLRELLFDSGSGHP